MEAPSSPLLEALTRLDHDLDTLVGIDPTDRIDGPLLQRLQAVRARTDGYVTLATKAFEASKVWATSGAKSAEAWLAGECGLPKSEARRQVRRGTELGRLPQAKEAWLQGTLTGDHVDAIARATAGVSDDIVTRDEEHLVKEAENDDI